jgi:hypothetical protein
MAFKESIVLTTGYTDATHVNAVAATMEADSVISDTDGVEVFINVPEVNWVGWKFKSVDPYAGDLHDFLVYTISLLIENGYYPIGIPDAYMLS